MYQKHFGLKRDLFDVVAEPSTEAFLGASQERAAEKLILGLSSPDAVVVLTGAPGIGKTTLALCALEDAAWRSEVTCLAMRPKSPDELLELLLEEFAVELVTRNRLERLKLWRELTAQHAASDLRTVILVENAQDLGADVLQSLDELTRADGAAGTPGVNLILTGRPDLDAALNDAQFGSLCQRITLRTSMGPMSAEDMREHFLNLAKRAGSRRKNSIFGPGSLEILHSYAGGVPRVAQYLCETALGLSAAREEKALSAMTVRDVAIELHGIRSNELAGGYTNVVPVPGGETRTATQQVLGVENGERIPTLTEVVGLFAEPGAGATATLEARNDDDLEDTDEDAAMLEELATDGESLDEQPVGAPVELESTDAMDEDAYEAEIEAALRAAGEDAKSR